MSAANIVGDGIVLLRSQLQQLAPPSAWTGVLYQQVEQIGAGASHKSG